MIKVYTSYNNVIYIKERKAILIPTCNNVNPINIKLC